jgi:glycosyl transferase family 4
MSGLRVLITNYTLATRSGTETYVRDLALGLASRGHTPLVYTPEPGPIAAELADGGIEVRDSLADFVAAPDIVHGHHTLPTLQALLHFPAIPGVYVCHDATHPIDTPPRFPRILRHVAVDENCKERIAKAGVPPGQVPVIYNSVDLARFKPRGPLPAQPTRALLFSNYANERTHLGPVREACARAGLALDVIGTGVGNPSAEPETVIGRYDLVFAKARCALEAMAVGTAVILCDFRGAGQMVTSADVGELQRWNFGARTLRWPLDPQFLLTQIARYDPVDAAQVSRRIRASAALEAEVDQFVALYGEVLEEWAHAPRTSRKREIKLARVAMQAAEGPIPLRERMRRIPLIGPILVMIKRAIFGPRASR